jgi:3-phosphoshikimate 1-carboxyvinyltransferase
VRPSKLGILGLGAIGGSLALAAAANLRAVGVESEARGNDLFVRGTTRPPRGRIETARDHRLAMAFAVLGTLPGADIRLSERASVAISYPRFFADVRSLRDTARGKRGA